VLYRVISLGSAPLERWEGAAMIRHTVVFRLKHPPGSHEEGSFLSAARSLSKIPGVENFEVLRQIGAKNNFSFGLSMEFADEAAYATYNRHAVHIAFVDTRWLPEVAEFLEIDYVLMWRLHGFGLIAPLAASGRQAIRTKATVRMNREPSRTLPAWSPITDFRPEKR
jgi:hypothetical protein